VAVENRNTRDVNIKVNGGKENQFLLLNNGI
jgi:hypothetical protein